MAAAKWNCVDLTSCYQRASHLFSCLVITRAQLDILLLLYPIRPAWEGGGSDMLFCWAISRTLNISSVCIYLYICNYFLRKTSLNFFCWQFFIDSMESGASTVVSIYIWYLLHLRLVAKEYQIIFFATGVWWFKFKTKTIYYVAGICILSFQGFLKKLCDAFHASSRNQWWCCISADITYCF